MTAILFHRARVAASELTAELDALLASIGGSDAENLRASLNAAVHEKPALVFTGQYSSGKSTLIRALTDGAADVIIDSDISTDSVDAFDWSGAVTLVDTPGVQAGLDRHDELAEKALRNADLVLFTVTVELFDAALHAHLQHVLNDLDKSRQTLVVLTKAATMAAAEGVREAAISDALGQHASIVPWVECDAAYYLKGLERRATDPGRAARYISASGVPRVQALINQVARDRGQLARFRQPLQQILIVATQADALLVDEPTEQSALIVLARQRAALSNRRERLDAVLERHIADFRSECIRDADTFADTIERLEVEGEPSEHETKAALETLNSGLDGATRRLTETVTRSINVQLTDLSSELSEIEASPHARVLIDLIEPDIDRISEPTISIGSRSRSHHAQRPSWVPQFDEYLRRFQSFWGAGGGSTISSSAGTQGHKIVLDVGHAFGKKFKPWEAVRMADRVGRVAKVGGVVVSIGIEAYAVYSEERAAIREETARAARRRALTFEVLKQCDDIASYALRESHSVLDKAFNAEFYRIDSVIDEIHAARQQRCEAASVLEDIANEARAILRDLAGDEEPLTTGV